MIEVSSEAVASQEDEDGGEDDDDDEEIPKYPMIIPSPIPTQDNANVTIKTLLVDQCMFETNSKNTKFLPNINFDCCSNRFNFFVQIYNAYCAFSSILTKENLS